jgi:hypothetical protein
VIKYEKKVWKVPRYYDTYINMRITRNSNSAIEFIKVMEHDTFMLFSMNGHSCIWFWCHLLNHINMILFKMSTRLFLRIYIFLGYWFIYGEISVCWNEKRVSSINIQTSLHHICLWCRWAEWNGIYRDDVRKFIKVIIRVEDTWYIWSRLSFYWLASCSMIWLRWMAC